MGMSVDLGRLADRPLCAVSDDELRTAIDDAFGCRAALDGLLVALVRELEGRGLPQRDGAANTTAWLRERERVSGSVAQKYVRAAKSLDTTAVVGDALRRGEVNLEQAEVIARQVTSLPVGRQAEAEKALLQKAAEFGPRQLHIVAGRIVGHVEAESRAGDPDGLTLAEQAEARRLEAAETRATDRRGLWLTDQHDGTHRLSGRLDAEGATVLRTVFDAFSRPCPADPLQPRSAEVKRVDALVEVCRQALAAGNLPRNGGDPVQVVVTMPVRTLQEQVGHATLDDGTRLSPAAARRLACDAGVIPAVLGGASQPLDVGRQRRLVTGPLRRAVLLRDRGCAFPACDRPPSWTSTHHIVHWVDGGTTCLANSVALCHFHHQTIHYGQWRVTVNQVDGLPDFWPPAYHHATGPLRNHRPNAP
jgi:hypothetical protein